MQHADEEQQKEEDYLVTKVKVGDLSSCDNEDLIVMINALKIQIECMNDDLDDKDEIIEELEHNNKKGCPNNVSRLESQETNVPSKDVIKALQNKIDDLTQENNEIFVELLKCSGKLKILQCAEKYKLIVKHQVCWLCGNNRHLHPVCPKWMHERGDVPSHDCSSVHEFTGLTSSPNVQRKAVHKKPKKKFWVWVPKRN